MLNNQELTDVLEPSSQQSNGNFNAAADDRSVNGAGDDGNPYSSNGIMSQTIIFTGKEGRNRRRSDYDVVQMSRGSQQQQGYSDGYRKGNGGSNNSANSQQTYRNRNGQGSKRTNNSDGRGAAGDTISNSGNNYSSYNNLNKFSSNEWLNLTSISGNTRIDAAALQNNLPEDMRISKLVRRLCNEQNPNVALELCGKLKIVIVDPNNVAYMRRSFDLFADSMVMVLKEGPEECIDEVAKIFGMAGYVIRNDFSNYKSWITKTYKNQHLRCLMMQALLTTLQLDVNTRDLVKDSARLMDTLKDYLENVEMSKLFVVITNTIKQFSLNYPVAFKTHFTDIVDIVVGWHLETDQTAEIKQHCSAILQGFGKFWASDFEFTSNLLGQFLEDIVVCGDEIKSDMGRLSPILDKSAPPEMCFASLVGAFISVLKCSWQSSEILVKIVGNELLSNSFEKIISVALLSLRNNKFAPEIIVPVNEFVAVILDCYQYNVEIQFDSLFKFIRLQLDQLATFTDTKVLSLLFVIIKILIELKTAIPFEFIEELFSYKSNLSSLKFVKSKEIYRSLVKIYAEILNIKNVLLLQEAYRHILIDIGLALKSLPSIKCIKWSVVVEQDEEEEEEENVKTTYTTEQAECIITFYLSTLSSLAISNSSIIAMWALQPNILELLVKELHTSNWKIWQSQSAIHYAIVNLLSAHCRKNSNFISSSSLLNSESTKITEVFNKLSLEAASSSPTSQHYSIVLEFMQELSTNRLLAEPQLNLLLDWLHQLLQQSAQYSKILNLENNFTLIAKNTAKIATYSSPDIQIKCANCFDCLMDYEQLNDEIFQTLAELCCVHMCSSDRVIRQRYSNIFAKLPLNVSLRQVNQFTGLAKHRSKQVTRFQHYHNSCKTTYQGMRPQNFRNFIKAMAFNRNADFIDDNLKDIFQTSCFEEHTGCDGDFYKTALDDIRCLVSWTHWEAAQYCVNNKLRTSLGKPQETFLKIETIIKECARILALKEKTNVQKIDSLIANQKHTRIMLGFLEALEKTIYNASNGTAFALPAPEKPAKTFFHINASTCNEWFNRIRTAVDLVALHCMEPEMVIRYSEVVLKNLTAAAKTNEPLFEHSLMSHAWALLRNGESDALFGLYTWSKAVTNRKFVWVKLAAEQAAGHRETAINGYRALLDSPDVDKLDTHVRDFIADQLSVCYYSQYQWNDMRAFLLTEETRSVARVTIPLVSITPNQLEMIMTYLDEKDSEVTGRKLCDWNLLEDDQDVSNDFSYHKLISTVENILSRQFILNDKSAEYEEDKSGLCSLIAQNCLQECLRTSSREHVNNLTIMNHIAYRLGEAKAGNRNHNIETMYVDKMFGSATLMRLLGWSDLLPEDSAAAKQVNSNLRLDVCSMARKEGNLEFCKRELTTFFDKIGLGTRLNSQHKLTINEVFELFIQPNVDMNLWDENMVRGVNETAKWMYCYSDKKENAIQFSASTTIGICAKIAANTTSPESQKYRERVARSLITLSEWMQGENEKLLINDLTLPLTRLVTSLPDVKPNYESASPSIVPIVDAAVGKLISYSITQCPNLAKAWGALGNWCYRWGRKMVELRMEHGDKAGLRKSDIVAITTLIPNASKDDILKIVAILNKHQVSPDDEEIGIGEACSTEIIESQLRTVSILGDLSQDHLHSIVEIWRQAHKTVYSYYEMSADAYFKYLQLATNSTDSMDNGDCSIVIATLRLLRLIVKHALGLQEVLEDGLATTPTNPWKVIIPQLFSRLNHHEPYVRKRVSELLCRVAQDSPHLIIFPTVVGADQEQRMDIADISMASEDIDADDEEKSLSTSGLTSCFNALLDILTKQAQETVHHVQLLVRELKRVTLLWDELWLVALAQVYAECAKRVSVFDAELRKLSPEEKQEKNLVFIEKHRILMRPVLFVMERLREMTSVKAETNNERNFQEKYTKIIDDTIETLRKPFDLDHPNESWHKLKSFYSMLQLRAQKRSSCTLKMMDISPILSKMKTTAISMPGVENVNEHQLIYIKSVDNIVHILPTKTKPKKLAFHGSDGKRYMYLFKGLEDLHLDERIMQFLSIANSMMTKSTDCNGNISKYRARHYSVIPLGPRSGLISWVDGVTPIFALYKKWQQRDAANPKKEKQPTVATTSTATHATKAPTSTRPTDLFVNKLQPLLAEHKFKITDSRKDWPVSVLKQVLSELSAETPRDLLSKELWCYSTNAATWRQVIRNYSQSIAVMSVIGYVIGLGDRHLDNILIELSTGEVVHIDYNVCFEKGKTLRVPEKVPFRMTPNLEEALGVTGIEGTFRLACEHVLKTLKKGRETLLTLLEAFVYDPLVDWAIGEDGAGALAVSAYGGEALGGELRQARKQLEHEVTRDTLALRFTEIKPEWTKNRDDVFHQLTQLNGHLKLLQNQRQDIQQVESQRDLLSKQMAMIREAEALGSAMGSHQLNSLSQRYAVYKRTKNEYTATKQALLDQSDNCHENITAYLDCVQNIDNDNMLEWLKDIDSISNKLIMSEFEIVKEFLESSAQGAVYLQADQTSKELFGSTIQQSLIVKKVFENLIEYRQVIHYHPQEYNDQHRLAKYSNWCRYLSENQSIVACRDVATQFQNTLGDNAHKPPLQQIMAVTYQLQTVLRDDNLKLQKTCARMQTELGSSEPNLQLLENVYEDTKSAITQFLHQESGAVRALECVALTALCDLNKRLLTMENAAFSSGDCLLDLTLGGKWFLDELYIITSIISEIIELIDKNDTFDDIFKSAVACLRSTNTVYVTLRSMNSQFMQNILSKTLHGIISENKSILDMISAVSSLQDGLQPIKEMISNLNLHLRCTVTNNPSPHKSVTADAHELRERLTKMKRDYQLQCGSDESTEGGRLFLAFNELFENVDTQHQSMVHAINNLNYPSEWMKVDQIKDAKDLAVLIFNPMTRSIFEDIYIVKRLETMIEIFTLCLQMACAFKSNGIQCPVYDDDSLARPLKKFIANHVCLQLGVASHSMSLALCCLLEKIGLNLSAEIDRADFGAKHKVALEELCRKSVDTSIKSGEFSNISLNRATTLCLNLDMAWRKKENVAQLQELIHVQGNSLKRTQQLLTAYIWMYEDQTSKQPGFVGAAPINRSSLLVQLNSSAKTLQSWKASITKIREEIASFVTVITQRLKWAVGANPGLADLLASFTSTVHLKRLHFDKANKLADLALTHCNSVLYYETFRHSSAEVLEQDQIFLNLVSRWEKSCTMAQTCLTVVTPVEEALVELLDPEGPIDHVWISNVVALIDDMTDQVQHRIGKIEQAIGNCQDNLHNCAQRLRTLMGIHHRMGLEIRTLLRSTLRMEGNHVVPIKDYLKRYKDFLDTISELHGNVLSKDFTEQVVTGTLQQITKVLGGIKAIFNDLFLFENDFKETPATTDATDDKLQDSLNVSPSKKNQKGTQTEQKRNAYAVSVWRRIRMKLEGRDPDPTRRCTVQEQVDWMIREAMNPDNLAVLYEGWTPWV